MYAGSYFELAPAASSKYKKRNKLKYFEIRSSNKHELPAACNPYPMS
jgi:hypothetical protein